MNGNGEREPVRLCVLHVGDLRLGVDALRVQEVIRRLPITPVPRSDAVIGGLVNLRGQIVTAIDVRQRLGLPADDAERMHLVVRAEIGTVSLLVDAVGDVVEPSREAGAARHGTATSQHAAPVTAVHTLDDMLLLEVDVDRLVDGHAMDAASG